MHLVGGRVLGLRKPWVGHYYHSTYTSRARGVGVLIRKSLPFVLLDLKLDPEGRYVVIHATVDGLPMVLVGLYIPSPATVGLLTKITQLVAKFPAAAVVLAGDFNMAPCPKLDKLALDQAIDSPLSCWASMLGLTDV